jgi:hypothetical protein
VPPAAGKESREAATETSPALAAERAVMVVPAVLVPTTPVTPVRKALTAQLVVVVHPVTLAVASGGTSVAVAVVVAEVVAP